MKDSDNAIINYDPLNTSISVFYFYLYFYNINYTNKIQSTHLVVHVRAETGPSGKPVPHFFQSVTMSGATETVQIGNFQNHRVNQAWKWNRKPRSRRSPTLSLSLVRGREKRERERGKKNYTLKLNIRNKYASQIKKLKIFCYVKICIIDFSFINLLDSPLKDRIFFDYIICYCM